MGPGATPSDLPDGSEGQRVTVGQNASAESQNTLDLDRGEVRSTFAVPNPATPNQADFARYTAPDYLGARYSRPPIGAATSSSEGNQVSVDTGVWLYDIAGNEAWTVELDIVTDTKSWVRRDIDALVPDPGNFVGRYPDNDHAVANVEKNGDFFYDTSNAELRQASNFIAGVVTFLSLIHI